MRSSAVTTFCRQARVPYGSYPELAYPAYQRGTAGTFDDALRRAWAIPTFASVNTLVRHQPTCLLGKHEGRREVWPTLLAAALAPDATAQVVATPLAIAGEEQIG